MKIAIPVHGNRVMPRFGCTREMVIVTVEGGQRLDSRRLSLTSADFVTLPNFLTAENVSVLICGGIHPRFQQIMQTLNIDLIWGVVGEWQQVVQAYLKGTLRTDPSFCLHHGQGRNRGKRLRGRQQRRGHTKT